MDSEDELIAQVATAMNRRTVARAAYEQAEQEVDAAGAALSEAWAALRTWQDERVAEAVLAANNQGD